MIYVKKGKNRMVSKVYCDCCEKEIKEGHLISKISIENESVNPPGFYKFKAEKQFR